MKRRLFTLAVIFFFFVMLLFPGPVFAGASQGILLWFRTVLPTLLPFMIAANLMVRTSAVHYISRLAGGVLGRVLKVSGCGAFAVLSGFLCGYPMGAKVTADLLKEGKICRDEAGYLLSFCNNTSPMFIVSYVVMQNIERTAYFVPSVAILFLSPVVCSQFFYRILRKKYGDSLDAAGRFKSPIGGRRTFFPLMYWIAVSWTVLIPSPVWAGILCSFLSAQSWPFCSREPEGLHPCVSFHFWRSQPAFLCSPGWRRPSRCGGC